MSEFLGFIEKKPISVELRNDFRDYGMSVIQSRALPDVRDGLKPVHRRILYAMFVDGNTSDKPHRKSAKSVGLVIGNYHPHGDSSVYDAMVRLSQPWNVRATTIDMHGNNGSMDGDSAAAMRYTEARLSKIAMEMLRDINKDTVDFQDNYDGSTKEPKVLPARFPHLLVNGSSGIAVGMATDIPTHNLKEVCEGTIAYMENPDITSDELMQYIKGPDFPTGGTIMGLDNIRKAYETGRTGKGSSIKLRAKINVLEKKGKTFLHVTELPYQVNKEKLLEKLISLQFEYNQTEKDRKNSTTKLVEEKGYDFAVSGGIVDETGRDEIAQNKVSIKIELKAEKDPFRVMKALYKHTKLEESISVNMLALVPNTNGGISPKTLPIKEILRHYVKHQMNVIKRKYQFELTQAEKRLKMLDALIKALDRLNETITTIRSATSNHDALDKLQVLLSIDEEQAQSILDRRLQTLASFQQDKLRDEHREMLLLVDSIQLILNDENKRKEIIKEDLREISEKYGTERTTDIEENISEIDDESLIPNDEVVVTLTHNGRIKRTKDSVYRIQRRKGRGVNGMSMYDDDFIKHLCYGRNHDTLLLFTNLGNVYETKMYKIMEASAVSKGYSIKSMFAFDVEEQVEAILNIQDFSDKQYLLFATKNGIVKKSKLSEYGHIRTNGIRAINLDTDKKTGAIIDRLIGVSLTNGESNITLVTHKGQSITFNEAEVSTIGRTGRGVKGINLTKGDSVISVDIHNDSSELLVVTDKGFGKRTSLSEFRVQARGGKGVAAIRLTDKNGTKVIGSSIVLPEDTLMLITKNEGKLMKLAVKEISQFQRNTQGTRIINLYEGDSLQQIARVSDYEDDETELTNED